MKILLVTEWFPEDEGREFTGGVETRAFFVSRELAKLGHEVVVVCRRRRGRGDWQPEGVRVIWCGKSGGGVAASWVSVGERVMFVVEAVVRGLKVDCEVVEGSNFVTYLPAFVIAKLKRVPVVAWWPDVLWGRWRRLLGRVGWVGEVMERVFLKLPWNGWIPISRATGRLLGERGVLRSKIYPVYLGVDLESIRAVKVRKLKRPTIVTIARLVSYKRVGDLVRAVDLVRQKSVVEDLRLLIIGEGPERKNLERLVGELGLGGGVKFCQNLERRRLIQMLRKSHVFGLASEVEGFGLVILEAAAAGLPYVAADIPAVREVTKGGWGGWLYPVGEVGELAEGIMNLLKGGEFYRQKVREGRKLAREYSWEKCARETVAVYGRVVKGGVCASKG